MACGNQSPCFILDSMAQTEQNATNSDFPLLKGKQRELLLRDEMYLDTARRVFLEDGFHALTISSLAEATGFTRGTIYQRFGSKEAVLVELWLQCQREMLGMMEKAVRLPGSPRERIAAIGEAIHFYAGHCPESLKILGAISMEVVSERITEGHNTEMEGLDVRMFTLMLEQVLEAMEKGDLRLPEDTGPASLCFAMWSLTEGCLSAMRSLVPLEKVEVSDPLGFTLLNVQRLLDGYHWRPLLSEWDFEAVQRRVWAMLSAEVEEVALDCGAG